MKRPEALETMCEHISQFKPTARDDDEFLERLRGLEAFNPDRQTTDTNFRRYYSELWLDIGAELANQSNPQLNINLDPISTHKSPISNLRFVYNKEGRPVAKSTIEQVIAGRKYLVNEEIVEYDKIVMVGRLPVVIEIRLTKFYNTANGMNQTSQKRRNKRKATKREKSTISYLMKKRTTDWRLEPVRQYFGVEDVGYVIFIPNDVYCNMVALTDRVGLSEAEDTGLKIWERDLKIWDQFHMNGGLVKPFPFERYEFMTTVIDFAKRYNLNIKVESPSVLSSIAQ